MVMRDRAGAARMATRTRLENPLAATHQRSSTSTEGPYANGDPMGSARDIQIAFTRMAMNDEETVALTRAVTRSARARMVAADRIGAPPDRADRGDGHGLAQPRGQRQRRAYDDHPHEGSWTPNPTQWTTALENLFAGRGADHARQAHRSGRRSIRMRPRRRMRISRAR
jgi:catalase-peroxidase